MNLFLQLQINLISYVIFILKSVKQFKVFSYFLFPILIVYVSSFKNHLLIIFNLTINKILNQRLFKNCFDDNNTVVFIRVSAVINNYTFSPFLY